MSKNRSGLFKKIAIPGAIISSACAALGNAFIEKFLSKNGIIALIEQDGLMLPEESRCFYESEEALSGIEFYRTNVYKKLFTFNKHGECLHSIFYENNSHIYAISCHGFTGDPSQNNIYAKHFYEMGYNVLLPYLRGHGKSEHRYCTMGWMDRLDIIDWINYIIEKDHEAKIILHGASMGAATVMNATGEELPDNVICCIEDCGFTTLWEQYSVQMSGMFKFPPEILLNIVNPVVKAKLGFNLKDNSPIEQVKKSKTPTLFIHGDKDTVVPFWMNYPLYQSANCEKERLVVEGATHAAAGYVYPEIYWDTITKFIDKHM